MRITPNMELSRCRPGAMILEIGSTDMYTSANEDIDLAPSRVTAWAGFIWFGAVMMVLSGSFSITWGIVGIVRDEVFISGPRGNVFDLDYSTWGWINLIVGIVVFLSGLALFSGSIVGSVVAVIVAMLSALSNLFVISAYPVWSVIVITLDVLVIYAITVHGDELRNN